MKRVHVNLAVDDLEASIRFYSSLFGVEPTMRKADYAKWMIDDPQLNLSISARGRTSGVDHLGLQLDSAAELDALHTRLALAGTPSRNPAEATCCYAKSTKAWVADPVGVQWELFVTHAASETYGEDTMPGTAPASSCCAPR
jgi:catechol 2,3-dioxygenase-like lactoylglutathione lyase family enzyme